MSLYLYNVSSFKNTWYHFYIWYFIFMLYVSFYNLFFSHIMPLGLILLVHVALDHLFFLLYGFFCVYQKESIVLLVDI